jgi:chemotaxis protein methyltransferase CheR
MGAGLLEPPEFSRIAALLRDEAGIELTPAKRPLVQSRLGPRLRNLGLTDYRAYCDFIEGAAGRAERLEMLSVLTTNVTGFFREPQHFDFIARHVLPDLAARLRRGRPVRLWSAGCASGEEPFSLALTVLAAIPEAARLDLRILASDIDPAVLRVAARGIYREAQLAALTPEQRRHFLPESDGRWRAGPALRAMISFRRLNLTADWPFTRPFDLVLCRNVAIYFGMAERLRLWSRLVDCTRPGGWLITGPSERLPEAAAAQTEPFGGTIYRRRAERREARKRLRCEGRSG